jgi:hypothetical protein
LTPVERDDGGRLPLIVDLKIPMIGLIKRKAQKVIVDAALKELDRRVARVRAAGPDADRGDSAPPSSSDDR